MSNTDRYHRHPHRSVGYEIRLRGHLDPTWTGRFEGWTVVRVADGETRLIGAPVDQAALYGLLKRVRDLGLPLLSVVPIPVGESDGDKEEEDADNDDVRADRA
jgi:hypothetical protein